MINRANLDNPLYYQIDSYQLVDNALVIIEKDYFAEIPSSSSSNLKVYQSGSWISGFLKVYQSGGWLTGTLQVI